MDSLADITLILDCSSSMDGIRDATVQGVNALIRQQKADSHPKVFSLLTFSSRMIWRRIAAPMQDLKSLADDEYVLSTGTRLLDAMGEAMMAVENRVTGTGKRRVLIATLTDGMEHSSRIFSRAQVFDMILQKRRKEGWDFLFLGANQDAIQSAADLGIPASHALNFNSTGKSAEEATGLLNNEITKFSEGLTTGFFPTQQDPRPESGPVPKPDTTWNHGT